MTICRLCEQGVVNKVSIKKTNEIVYLCIECEALWLTKEISSINVLNFDTFMEKRNLKPVWSEVEILELL